MKESHLSNEPVLKSSAGTTKRVIFYGTPTFLLVAIQFVGIHLTDDQLRPLHPGNPVLGFIGALGLVLSLLTPILAIVALTTAVKNALPRFRILLLLFAVSALLLSLFGCAWTTSGHPTWYQGYL